MKPSSSLLLSPRFFKAAVLWLTILGCADPGLSQSNDGEIVVAVVNGQAITVASVDQSITPQLYPLQQQIYALRKVALDNLIARSLLEAEAAKKRLSLDELKKQLTAGSVDITKEQIEGFYLENATAFASMSSDEAKERLRMDLESQARMRKYRAAIAALKENAAISVFLDEPRLRTIDSKASSRGPNTAPVVITEFSDFQCPYCREAQTSVKELLSKYHGQVRLVFKHLPLDIHAQAFMAARATVCAGEQNKFWEMHDALFGLDDLSEDRVKHIVDRLGLDKKVFDACVVSERSRNLVKADLLEARRLGINSTPTFLINGKIIRGLASFETFKGQIDKELELLRTRTAPSSTQEK